MAAAFLPIALGVGVLFLAASADAKPKKNGKKPKPPGFPGTTPPTEACVLDAHMPEAIRESTKQLLANVSLPASTLIAASQIADVNGFPQAAQCLRNEAAVRGGPQTPPPGFNPHDPTTWGNAIPGFPGIPSVPGGPPGPTIPTAPPGMPPPPPPPGGGPPGQPPPPPGTPPPPPGTPPPPPGTQPGGTIPVPGIPGGIPVPPIPPGFPVPPGFPGLPGLPGTPPPGTGIGPMPFTIRSGDRPWGLGVHYTGVGSRFREIEPLNPHLGPLSSGVPPYPNWQVGVEIMLPAEWDPWNKPTMPVGI